jgi:hypothetical protein
MKSVNRDILEGSKQQQTVKIRWRQRNKKKGHRADKIESRKQDLSFPKHWLLLPKQ